MASIPPPAVGFYALTLGPRREINTQQGASSGSGGGDRSTGSGGKGGGSNNGGRGPSSFFPEFPPPPSGWSWLSIFLSGFGGTLFLACASPLLYGLLSQVWGCGDGNTQKLWIHISSTRRSLVIHKWIIIVQSSVAWFISRARPSMIYHDGISIYRPRITSETLWKSFKTQQPQRLRPWMVSRI